MSMELLPEWMAELEEEDVDLYQEVYSGLRITEGGGGPVWGDLSHGTPAAWTG